MNKHNCPFCPMGFVTPLELQSHVQKHYSNETIDNVKKEIGSECTIFEKTTLVSIDSNHNSPSQSDSKNNCKIFENEVELQSHIQKEHSGEETDEPIQEERNASDCGIGSDHSALEGPEKLNKKFRCSECPYSTNFRGSLKYHLLTHSGERPFQCELCDKAFIHKGHLTRHLLVHTGERPYVCDTCGNEFSDESSYHHHGRIMEGKCQLLRLGDGNQKPEKKFRCPECPYSTNHKGRLKQHRVTHTGERPYVCDACGKQFSDKSNFRRHEQIMKGKCHLSKHRECPQKPDQMFHCTQCPYSADRKGHLDNHMLIHSGERPHQCELCDKTFTLKSHLKRHRLVHTGERPYVCDTCGKGFSEVSSLRYHKVRLHEVKKVSEGNSAFFTRDNDPCAPLPSNE